MFLSKPLLIGMNNPVSLDPWHVLYPMPRGCAGNRLYEMLREVDQTVTMHGYVHRFDRVNLVAGRWHAGKARASAYVMRPGLAGRRVVLLGREVARAFAVADVVWSVVERENDGTVFYLLPHPSGRNPAYNDPDARRRAGVILAELYRASP